VSNRDENGRERAWAECRVDICQTPAGEPDYTVYRLNPTALTLPNRMGIGVPVAHFGLWQNTDAKTPVSLLVDGIVIQFKEVSGVSVNLEDNSTLTVSVNQNADFNKNYIVELTLRGAILTSGPDKGKDNPNFPYIIHQLDSGTYAIMLDATKPEAAAKAKKSAALTLEIWLEGNVGTKPVTTTKVTMLVNRG